MSNNPLTNQSYINKDFQTIYPELLDLVKKLSYKWDPTISNESDPGVVLIKLNAIIADKNNYNIDKNILECFPDTVTQHNNAYKLFEQLGYNMHWYRAAKGDVTFTWKSEKVDIEELGIKDANVKVPQFTMVSDDSKEIVYTTLDELSLKTTGENATVGAIQGVIRNLSIGGSTLIKSSMLDHKNRVYFPVSNVAENGIFISDANRNSSTGETKFVWRNPDTSTIDGWTAVDNLYIYPLDYKCYKFGIDQSNNTCYIEFPANISNLIGEGIQIKYIQTDGASGNIAAKRISKFYNDVEHTTEEGSIISISSNSLVANYTPITNGEEPETIDDAYVSYKKVVGTFDTLVTLRDYLNYIVNDEFEQVSNGVVADRLNDIQSSYEIVTTSDGVTTKKPIVAGGDTPEMNAFDLKTYFLEYSRWPKFSAASDASSQMKEFKNAYDKSFELKLGDAEEPLGTGRVKDLYRGSKRIEHDFISKLPNKPLLFKNKFKLNLTVIPDNTVSQAQADDIEKNVYEAVLKNLSSKNISFGEEISFETVYDICNNADNRIKAVALDSLEYTPYAVVYLNGIKEVASNADKTSHDVTFNDGKSQCTIITDKGYQMPENEGIIEIPIPAIADGAGTMNDDIALDIVAKNVLSGTTPLYHALNGFTYNFEQQDSDIIEGVKSASTFSEIVFPNTVGDYESIGGDKNNSKILDGESLFLYAPYLKDEVTYSQSMKYIYYTTSDYTGYDTDYIPANVDYVLSRGQTLFVFWKDEDSKDAPYSYAKHGEGTILKASLKLIKSSDPKYGDICSNLQSYGYEGEGQILGELNDRLYDVGDTILSSNKTIVIKKINSVSLTDKNNYCYWITNDITTDTFGNQVYGLTFNYVEPDDTNVTDSYHSGLVYISTFGWSNKTISSEKTLGSGDRIYILEPVQRTISYNAKNDTSGVLYVKDQLVTDYVVRNILSNGAKIRCTGNIIQAPQELLQSLLHYGVGSTIPWGDISNKSTVTSSVNAFDNIEVFNMGEIDASFAGSTYRMTYKDGKLICSKPNDPTFGPVETEQLSTDNANAPTYYIWRYLPIPSKSCTVLKVSNTNQNIINYQMKNGDYFEFTMGPSSPAAGVRFYTMVTTYTDGYYVPVTNSVAATIDANPQYILSNGYKIDLIGADGATPTTCKFDCILKANEEFIYTDTNKKGLYFHSNGTKITIEKLTKDLVDSDYHTVDGKRVPKPFTLKVKTMDTSKIHGEQLKAFTDDMWYNFKCECDLNPDYSVKSFNKGELVTITENQIISLGAGTEVNVKLDPITVPTYADGAFSTTTVYDPQFTSLKINSQGIYVSETYDGTEGWKVVRNALSNYTLRYRDSASGADWSELPSSSHPDIGWDGYMILNISSGPNKPQKLSASHKHRLNLITQTGKATVDAGSSGHDIHIQTKHTMTLDGGTNIDMTGLTPNGDVVYTDILQYTQSEDNFKVTDGYSVEKSGDEVLITINASPSANVTVTLNCSIPAGVSMLMPVEFLSDYEVDSFLVEASAGTGAAPFVFMGNEGLALNYGTIKKGVYYGIIDTATTVTFKCKSTKDISFKLNKLFPYTQTDDSIEDDKVVDFGSLTKEIGTLDIDNIFDYTYQPEYDSIIENPLNPKSFFSPYHNCNAFTIPQISEIKIKTMNKRS